MAENDEKRLTEVKEWRHIFTPKMIEQAESIVENGEWSYEHHDEYEADARLRPRARRGRWYDVEIRRMPQCFSDDWDPEDFWCSCSSARKSYYYYPPEPCAHQAALLLKIEKERGPWEFTETDEEMEERLLEERRSRETARREQQRKEEEKTKVAVTGLFPKHPKGKPLPYYDLRKIFSGTKTNLYRKNRAIDILENGTFEHEDVTVGYGRDGQQTLSYTAEIFDGLDTHRAKVELSSDGVNAHYCTCQKNNYYMSSLEPLCEHELALMGQAWDYIEKYNPGDATDLAAENFFQLLDQADIVLEEDGSAAIREKEKVITIVPRITVSANQPKLSFKVAVGDGKPIILKKLSNFVEAVDKEETFALSKTVSVDFKTMDVTEESEPWLTFIQRRVGETERVNDRLYAKSYYGYGSYLTVQNQEVLTGSTLDRFYDLAEGLECEYQNKAAGGEKTIRVGHANMSVKLQTAQIVDSEGNFVGIGVTGTMPVILEGVSGNYILDGKHLSRISREENQALEPFRKTASSTGQIRFQVGKARLSEFYYRVVPNLIESSYVDFDDNCAQDVEEYLPPEPEFAFQLDLEDEACVCRVRVSYGGYRYALPGKEILKRPSGADAAEVFGKGSFLAEGYHDELQEDRVVSAVTRYFPKYLSERKEYKSPGKSPVDEMFQILTEAVPLLSKYGEVQGSEEFRTHSVKPVPQVKVGVSIESGIMDISVLSKGISPEELLNVLKSYRKKKKYYRLKSGDFIDLYGDDQLASLDDMMKSLDLSSEDVICGNVKIPAFRALYLDKMLESHEDLVADRDKTYRKLIKNFRTIRDADYEPTAGMEDILRPYQMYGYKWLRTIAAVGFGGILADEMGLGKTLQTIAMIAALFAEGEKSPALIVCPASLVYNWQEEFIRFAPEISVCPIVGTVAVRKKIFDQIGDLTDRDGAKVEGEEVQADEEAAASGEVVVSGEVVGTEDAACGYQVYITSYDLLRKDIVQYEKRLFSVMVIDEAQYIKNQKAAMTKAVKVVQAKHRFALTGTPIENRLAELWSIFDFLMPGFLYKYDDFAKKFEVPIAKEKKKEPADRLKQMVGPFILRRLKTDVLKDLPSKLEEVRYARFEEEQRKVYDGQVVRMKKMLSGAENDKIRIFAELTRIRQICCDPSLFLEDYHGGSAKRQACIELVKSAIGGGHKVLLFSQFTSMLSLLEEDLEKEEISWYKITGSTPKEKRVRMVRDFNENDVPVFLISLKAGGTGLNLTGADVVIHYDPWWNVAAQNQATDRAHRIGQKNQVTVYRLIMKDTIEEKILALQEAKKDLADAILSGESESIYALSGEELLALL